MKYKVWFMILGYLILILTSCRHDFIFKGTIYNKHNHKPVVGAYVQIDGTGRFNNLVETDSMGHYQFELHNPAPNSTFTISVDATSLMYQREERKRVISLTNDNSGTFTADLMVVPFYEKRYLWPTVPFEFNKSVIPQNIKDTLLPDIIDLLKDTIIGGHYISIDGYASEDEGDSATKYSLSLARANAVKDYLILKGIPTHCIAETRALGDSRPLNGYEHVTTGALKTAEEKENANAINRCADIRFVIIESGSPVEK